MIKGMDHIGISVSDLGRAIAFYRDLLGMELVAPEPFGDERYSTLLGLKNAQGKVALVRSGSLQIELFEFAHPQPKAGIEDHPVCDHGISHFCIKVTHIHDLYARLRASGVVFNCPPMEFFGKALATYGRDPDGNIFELLEMIETDEA